ncbi:MAG: sigma-70 family RNA polymerase sigma factor [Planctomycetia bacterium]|nr:sigma-70 family RNA polymerase sigma factor [Planctomycetia bacterium]
MKTIRSDAELVKAFQQGNQEVFEEIDERCRPRLERFLTRKAICSERDREDRIQQTMIRVFENLKDLENGAMLIPWIYRIAVRHCIDESRKKRIACESDLIPDADPANRFPDPLDQKEGDPAVNAEQKECSRNLWSAAERILSEQEFQILWLFYMEEYSSDEIGALVHKKSGTVRVFLLRAKRKLAAFLQSWRN